MDFVTMGAFMPFMSSTTITNFVNRTFLLYETSILETSRGT